MYNDANELLAVAKLSKPLLKSFDIYNDWLNHGYFNENEGSIIVKQAGTREFLTTIHSNTNRDIWFGYNLRVHHSSLNDYGIKYEFDLHYRPNSWLDISTSYNLSDYNDKYNFLNISVQ